MNMDYHDRPELSSSQVASFIEDPIEWYHVHALGDWPKPEPTPQMRYGTLVHRMIELGGPDKLGIVPRPDGIDLRTKEGKAWRESNGGKEIVDKSEWRGLSATWDHLHRNDHTSKWTAAEDKETEIIWTHAPTGLACRSMIDVIDEGIIVDWKTTSKLDPRLFQGEICTRNYDIRLAFYQRAVESKRNELLPVVCVAIQNGPGYGVRPYEIPERWMSEARDELERVLESLVAFDIAEVMNSPIMALEKPKYRFSRMFELNEVN